MYHYMGTFGRGGVTNELHEDDHLIVNPRSDEDRFKLCVLLFSLCVFVLWAVVLLTSDTSSGLTDDSTSCLAQENNRTCSAELASLL